MSNDNLKTWPERIYLQHTEGDEPLPYAEATMTPSEDAVTWCEVRQDRSDVEYVRADVAAVPAHEQAARHAIDGAIAYGRDGVNQPADDHWLMPYWQMGKRIAELEGALEGLADFCEQAGYDCQRARTALANDR